MQLESASLSDGIAGHVATDIRCYDIIQYSTMFYVFHVIYSSYLSLLNLESL